MKERIRERIKFVENQFNNLIKSSYVEINSKDLLKLFGQVLSLTLLAQCASEIESERLQEISRVYDLISFENYMILLEDSFRNMDLIKWMHKD
jgi:hypothetical protein